MKITGTDIEKIKFPFLSIIYFYDECVIFMATAAIYTTCIQCYILLISGY